MKLNPDTIRQIRQDLGGLSVADLTMRLSMILGRPVTTATVHNWEREDTSGISADHLAALAQLSGRSMDALAADTAPSPTPGESAKGEAS